MKKINILNVAILALTLAGCEDINTSSSQNESSESQVLTSESTSNTESTSNNDSSNNNSSTISEESSSSESNSSSPSESSGENDSSTINGFSQNDLDLLNKYFGISIPFSNCSTYSLTDYSTNDDDPYVLIGFFDVTDTNYSSYLNDLDNQFNYDYSELDEDDGLTYYYYSYNEEVLIDVCKDEDYVKVAIYLAEGPSTDYSEEDKALLESLFTQYTIPFLNCDYYLLSNDTENGLVDVSFYFNGVDANDFTVFQKSIEKIFNLTYSSTDEDGGNEYEYAKDDMRVYLYSYFDQIYSYVAMEIYHKDVYDDTDNPGSGDIDNPGSGDDDVEIITNKGKGLPSSSTGVYDVNFANKNVKIKNVTELGDYLDGCPTTGSPAVLVIPVQFSDVTASSKGYTIENIKNAFLPYSQTNASLPYYSVYDYFYESSNGKLTLDIDILDEWFTPKNASSYYKNKKIGSGQDAFEAGEQYVMDEALSYLSNNGVDLSKYDSDNNGTIDSIVLINTLEIDTTGESVFNWAFRYWNYLVDNNNYYYEYNNVSANDYLWCSYQFLYEDDYGFDGKNPTNTYTFIHEFSHILGADDYYDTEGIQSPLNGFDVMDSSIADHSPFTKFVYGWITNSRLIVTDSSVTVDLNAFESSGDTIIFGNNFDETLGIFQEYYIVTYYNNTGLNANGYGNFEDKGVVVYHINASLYKTYVEGYGDYYGIYNTNTDESNEYYGTADNLIEYVKNGNDFVFNVNDSLSTNIKDDQGNKLLYSFTINSMDENKVSITFNKNN